MKQDYECVGGPLDGRAWDVDDEGVPSAFPYPEGWYYLRFCNLTAQWLYRWDPQGFIESDRSAIPCRLNPKLDISDA